MFYSENMSCILYRILCHILYLDVVSSIIYCICVSVSDLWIMAAKWEFEANINPENARTLLQRGLRFNDTSKQLWIEVSEGAAGADM